MASRIDSHHAEAGKSVFGSMRSFVNEEMKDFVRNIAVTGERKSSSSGDCDQEFVDARDTLSNSGSSYLNCSSMSHFAGLDDLDDDAARGNYPSDPQTQALMMERFLPAAKALASEKPKFSPRKLSSPREPSQRTKQTPLKPTLRYGPSFTKRYSNLGKDADGDQEEVQTYYHDHGSLSQGCGILPRLLKGSVFLNPVPGSSTRMRGPFSPATRTRPKPQVSVSLTKRVREDKKYPSDSQNIETAGSKIFQDKVIDKRSDSGSHVDERIVYVDTVQNLGTPSSFSSGSQDSCVVSRDGDKEIAAKTMNQLHILKDIKTITCKDVETLPIDAYNDPHKLLSRLITVEKAEVKYIEHPSEPSASDPNDSENPPPRPTTVKKQQEKYSPLPVAPPLPKSPADSWLSRTLPSVSKNASAPSFPAYATNRKKKGFKVQPRNQGFE